MHYLYEHRETGTLLQTENPDQKLGDLGYTCIFQSDGADITHRRSSQVRNTRGMLAEATDFLGRIGLAHMAETLAPLNLISQIPLMSLGDREAVAAEVVREALKHQPDKATLLTDWSRYPRLGRLEEAWRAEDRLAKRLNKTAPSLPGRRARPVIGVDNDARFDNARAAAEGLGVSLSSLYAHLGGDPRYKTVRGLRYQYATA